MILVRPIRGILLSVLLVSGASAQLAPSSPFIPGGDKGSAAAQAGSLELRGIMTNSEGTFFCIYDTTKKTGTWVALNESGNGFVVTGHDSSRDTATIEADGRTVTLALHEGKVTAGGGPGPVGMVSPSVQPSGVPPADEARRLDSVAAEIQRRRLLREQASGRTLPPPPPVQPPPGMGRPGN